MRPIDRAYQKARECKIPFHVQFDLTYRCHQRCVHCYLPEEWLRGEGPGPELDTSQVKSVLEQLAAAGTFLLTFSGGEIFLRPDLIEIVKYARGLNFAVALKTSGTLGPNDEQLEALAEVGLDSLQISFYSVDPSLHDRVTGLPGSWERLWRTTERCRARGLRVAFMSTIFSFTFDQINPINDFSLKENIFMKMNGVLDVRWDGKPSPLGLAIGPERSREIRRLMGDDGGPAQECESGQSICYLTPQGNLWPCIGIACNCGKITGGDSFSRVWHDSQKLNAIRGMQGLRPEGEPLCLTFLRTMEGTIKDQFILPGTSGKAWESDRIRAGGRIEPGLEEKTGLTCQLK